jgi:hypothetical protein
MINSINTTFVDFLSSSTKKKLSNGVNFVISSVGVVIDIVRLPSHIVAKQI